MADRKQHRNLRYVLVLIATFAWGSTFVMGVMWIATGKLDALPKNVDYLLLMAMYVGLCISSALLALAWAKALDD